MGLPLGMTKGPVLLRVPCRETHYSDEDKTIEFHWGQTFRGKLLGAGF